MALGKIVKSLREARGWTLKDLSKRSGVPVGTIGALEVRDSVRSEYAAKLAIGFGIPLEELLPATATATPFAPSPILTATGSALNQPLGLIQQAHAAINVESLPVELQVICNAFSKLPDDSRTKVLADILQIITQAQGPPSNQGLPAYSHAATRAA